MISREFMARLGLNNDQITLLSEALEKEARYRKILCQEKVNPKVIESIMSATDLEKVDFEDEKLLRELISVEWNDFILK